MDFDIKVNLPNANRLIKELGLEPYGRIQYVVDSAIVTYSAPYTPKDTGRTQDSVNSSIGSGVLVYPGPYAHYIYVGISKTGKPLVYQKKNPLATSHWIEEAMRIHLDDVCRIAEREVNNG